MTRYSIDVIEANNLYIRNWKSFLPSNTLRSDDLKIKYVLSFIFKCLARCSSFKARYNSPFKNLTQLKFRLTIVQDAHNILCTKLSTCLKKIINFEHQIIQNE